MARHINDHDPTGTRGIERRASREAKRIIDEAMIEIARTIREQSITDPIEVQRITDSVMSRASRVLSEMGLQWVRDGERAGIARADVLISKDVSAGIQLGPQPLPESVRNALMLNALNDIASLDARMRATVGRTIAEGMEQGLGPRQVAKTIMERTGTDRNTADLMAREVVLKTSSATIVERQRQVGYTEWEMYPTRDDRLCAKCRAYCFKNGQGGELKRFSSPPVRQHPRCRCIPIGLKANERPDDITVPAIDTSSARRAVSA